jgi:hypothetical protein
MLSNVPIERRAVSVAMAAPDAVTKWRETETIQISFLGRFGFGLDQWAYLPSHEMNRAVS